MPLPPLFESKIKANDPKWTCCLLKSSGIDDNDVEKLIDLLNNNPHIIALDLYRNNLSGRGAATLVAKLPLRITKINLGYNNISDKELEHIIKSVHSNVQEVDLSMNSSLTDIGALQVISYLNDVSNKRTKIKINLAHTKVSPHYVQALYSGDYSMITTTATSGSSSYVNNVLDHTYLNLNTTTTSTRTQTTSESSHQLTLT